MLRSDLPQSKALWLLIVVAADGKNIDILIVKFVNDSILLGKSAGPETGKAVL